MTAVQASIVQHVSRCQKLYGPCPDSVQSRGALLELLKLPSMYEEAPFGLADFDYDSSKVLHRPPRVVDVRERLPSAVRHFLDHPGRYIERSGADIERLTDEGKAPPKPYWCPRLRSSPGER